MTQLVEQGVCNGTVVCSIPGGGKPIYKMHVHNLCKSHWMKAAAKFDILRPECSQRQTSRCLMMIEVSPLVFESVKMT